MTFVEENHENIRTTGANHVAACSFNDLGRFCTGDASFSVGHRDRTDPGICSTGVTKCVPSACCTKNESGESIGFMGTENNRLEMLFLSPKECGKGIGKQMLQYGMEQYGIRELTVNEQNPQAVVFYTHLGFETYKRAGCDEEGNSYPLLYMTLKDTEGKI